MYIETGFGGNLPLIFIPYYIVDKLKHLGEDYIKLFGSSKTDFDGKLSNGELMEVDALNGAVENKFETSNIDYVYNIYSTYNGSKSSLMREMMDRVTPKLSIDNSCRYIVAGNDDGKHKSYSLTITNGLIFIILNSNFMSTGVGGGFEATFKSMSYDICEAMFKADIDSSIITNSIFFKSIR